MKECFLKFADEDSPQAFGVEASGHGFITPGEYRARADDFLLAMMRPGWWRVRIGDVVDHIGSRTIRGGAVYAAEKLSVPEPTSRQTELF